MKGCENQKYWKPIQEKESPPDNFILCYSNDPVKIETSVNKLSLKGYILHNGLTIVNDPGNNSFANPGRMYFFQWMKKEDRGSK